MHLRIAEIKGVPATTLMPIERCIRDFRVHISPKQRREEIHLFDVNLTKVGSICSKGRGRDHA